MKASFFLVNLALIILMAAGCTAPSEPAATVVPSPSGDIIATAVAGTLAASAAKTATLSAQLQQTALAVTPSPTPTLINTLEATATATPTALPTQVAVPALPGTRALTVAFVGAGNNVWVWRNGQSKALTQSGDGTEVAISDDGRWIAFTRSTASASYSLWAIGSDGQGERALMDADAFASLPRAPGAVAVMTVMFNWAPGTHTVAFSTRPIFEGPGLLLNDDLWLVNVESLERSELLPAGKGGKFYYSPDGKQIALVKSTSISLINADGSNRRDAVLTFPEVSTYSEYLYYPAPAWLPDGSGLRVVIPPKAALEHPEESATIWEVPVDGGAARQIGSVHTVPALRFPQLSPDGSHVAYFKQVEETTQNRSELHIANADGSDDTVYITEILITFIAWSPDAQHFFFTTTSTNQPWIGAVGAPPQPVTGVASAMEARWMDTAHFLFVTHTSGSIELRQGDLTGSSQALTSFPGEDGVPLLYDFSFAIP